MSRHSNRLVIVTGTSSGIGDAVARRKIDEGWSVIGIARRPSPLAALSIVMSRSISQPPSALAGALERALGSAIRDPALVRIGLVNDAADPALLGPLERADPIATQRAYAINTLAPIVLAGLVLRGAPRTAAVRIVNVSSGAAVAAFTGLGTYGGTKAALRMAGMAMAPR